MRQFLAAAALVSLVAGCNGGFGSTRVPAPVTGSVSGQPYYQPGAATRTEWSNPAAQATTVAAATPAPAPAGPAAEAAPSLSPQSLAATPVAAQTVPTQPAPIQPAWGQTASVAPALPAQPIQPTLPVRPVQPAGPVHGVPYHGGVALQATPPSVRYSAPGTPVMVPAANYTSAAVAPTQAPAAFQPQGPVRPIVPAPQVSGYASTDQSSLPLRGFDTRETAEVGSGVAQPTSAAQPVATPGEVAATAWSTPTTTPATVGTSSTPTAVGGPAGRYGYMPDYSQLSGRLEFEQATGRWKLRYIPHDAPNNQIDNFGGSVVLANTGQLQNLRAGDYVRVAGQIAGDDSSSADFAPTYQVAQVFPVN